jgi:hypothetical protein
MAGKWRGSSKEKQPKKNMWDIYGKSIIEGS